ncbi:class I SAM-dependent methyltransferase [Saprospira sp. CCB-QB6]|uniref:class I SAM-dependent methyltransferase n=1 Tax=Saprospira sp. CCB-QB6 TaxID=3023936 RepID=UPI002349F3F5|nr:class I SAM-dependent methyltransferase [Saprospira sp. CCB-QB6]WCL81384.1 class I SAM-dependent methyltransferase [Saprospira sp. CCB-QB6]
MLNTLKRHFKFYRHGKAALLDKEQIQSDQQLHLELNKEGSRTEIINFLLQTLNRPTTYLEIGVRDPSKNFDKIKADQKYSVDPGVEFKENPVDFKLTSDDFFAAIRQSKLLSADTRFDLIFIDGLHLAEQVDRDIKNALDFIKDDGFIVLHDCNPPTIWHAREKFYFAYTPATGYWNGTTWKAFVKARQNKELYSCCIDTDWGVGLLSKSVNIGAAYKQKIEFYEYQHLDDNRKEILGLISYPDFIKKLS